MDILVDAVVWSLVFRRANHADSALSVEMDRLIEKDRVCIIGAIRQEVLSGIRHQNQFERLKEKLRTIPDLPVMLEDYERAGEMFNQCRQKGIQGSNTDFLMCAVSERCGLSVFTFDKDFQHFQTVIPLHLHSF